MHQHLKEAGKAERETRLRARLEQAQGREKLKETLGREKLKVKMKGRH